MGMHAHRGVVGGAISTTLLKVSRVVFEESENFPKRLKKTMPYIVIILFFNQTGVCNLIVCIIILNIGCT